MEPSLAKRPSMNLEPPAVFLLRRSLGKLAWKVTGDADLLRGDWREELGEREKQQKHTRSQDADTGNWSRIVAIWVHKQK